MNLSQLIANSYQVLKHGMISDILAGSFVKIPDLEDQWHLPLHLSCFAFHDRNAEN